jgi:3-oxoacyl-[acyl-carrier-protein] synthase II
MRVAVTGLGVASPWGKGLRIFEEQLLAGHSAVRRLEGKWAGELPAGIAACADWLEAEDAAEALAECAAREAWEHAGWKGPMDRALFAGAIGWRWPGQAGKRPVGALGMAEANLAALLGFPDSVLTGYSACAASAQVIGEAAARIRSGESEVALCGGADSRCHEMGIASYARLEALALGWEDRPEEASRPFDARRNGFVVGEGGAFLVLEAWDGAVRRGAEIHGEILGFAMTTDAYRATDPDPEGREAERCMRLALERAGVAVEEVAWVSAHGTSTRANDAAEAAALGRVFGGRGEAVPVAAFKSQFGHWSMAAAAGEMVAALVSLRQNSIPPILNLENPPPVPGLEFIREARGRGGGKVVLKNSFGFGGQNGCVVLAGC